MSEHCHEQMPFYIEGGLSPDGRERIEAHLRECDSCRAELDQWRAIAEAVRLRAQRSAASLPPMKLPASHLDSMNHRPTPPREGINRFVHVRLQPLPKVRLPGMTLVATIVMMIFAALVVLRFSQPSASSSTAVPTPTEVQTVYEILQQVSRFSLYAELVGYSDWLTSILDGNEPVTLFVMMDDDLLPVLNQLGGLPRMEGHTWEEALLFSHMVNDAWTLEELRSINFVPGEWERAGLGHYRIGVNVDADEQGKIVLNADTHDTPVHILEGDIMASNGVIHVVDRTLLADDVFSPPTLSTHLQFDLDE
jgi:hypothetical protein